MKNIILASGSPRRSELLSQVGLPFRTAAVECSDFEEGLKNIEKDPERYAALAADGKLDMAIKTLSPGPFVILCADTVVEAGGEIFGKPADARDAERMLRALSGQVHRVITACAMAELPDGPRTGFMAATSVEFYPLTDGMIASYIESGEPFDKAGAYGIQGRAAAFVKTVSGCYANVVGLPVSRVLRELADVFSMPVESYWNTK